MKKFTLHRDYTVRSTNGVISFKKDEPTAVPPELHREVIAIGAQLVEGSEVELIDAEKPAKYEPNILEREEELFAAFEIISERNDSNDFTGAGTPTVKAIERIVEFDVERKEITDTWAAWRIKKAEGSL